MNPPGIASRQSPYSVKETIDRLEQALRHNGVTIYARIDQQEELRKAEQQINPLEFLLFGNPKAGGPVMISNPMASLDLPLKVIAWQNEKSEVWVAYNDSKYIQERYTLPEHLVSPLNLQPLLDKVLG